jgi:hypothetical protein
MVKFWMLAVAVLIATDAVAQSVIVTGGYYREIKRFSGDPTLNVLDTEANGVQLGVGTMVTPRCEVALEVGVSEGSSVTRSTSVAFEGQTVDVQTQYANRLITWSALVGLRGPQTGRLQITYLGGITFSHLRREITPESQAAILQPAPPPTTSVTIDDVAAATVGVDAAVRAADHLTVVVFLRANALRISSDLAGFAMRSGIAAQFSF